MDWWLGDLLWVILSPNPPGIAAGHTSFRLVGVKDPPWHRVPWIQWPGRAGKFEGNFPWKCVWNDRNVDVWMGLVSTRLFELLQAIESRQELLTAYCDLHRLWRFKIRDHGSGGERPSFRWEKDTNCLVQEALPSEIWWFLHSSRAAKFADSP